MIAANFYKKIQKVIPIACVDIVVKNSRGEFLLLKRKNRPAKDKWWFPGGRIKKGESLEKTAIRKIKEETGLKVALKKILGVDQTIFQRGIFGGSVHNINIVFLAEARRKPKLILDKQSSNYKWFNKVYPTWHPYVRKFLKLSGFKYDRSH